MKKQLINRLNLEIEKAFSYQEVNLAIVSALRWYIDNCRESRFLKTKTEGKAVNSDAFNVQAFSSATWLLAIINVFENNKYKTKHLPSLVVADLFLAVSPLSVMLRSLAETEPEFSEHKASPALIPCNVYTQENKDLFLKLIGLYFNVTNFFPGEINEQTA